MGMFENELCISVTSHLCILEERNTTPVDGVKSANFLKTYR